MKINSFVKRDVVILEPVGKLLPGSAVGQLDDKLYSLIGKKKNRVIIDLGKTSQVGSSGISILLHHHMKFKEIGGSLKLANLTRNIQQIIAITRLSLVFDVFDSLEEALDSYGMRMLIDKDRQNKIILGSS
jgi:anti-sigma B factor antagonist